MLTKGIVEVHGEEELSSPAGLFICSALRHLACTRCCDSRNPVAARHLSVNETVAGGCRMLDVAVSGIGVVRWCLHVYISVYLYNTTRMFVNHVNQMCWRFFFNSTSFSQETEDKEKHINVRRPHDAENTKPRSKSRFLSKDSSAFMSHNPIVLHEKHSVFLMYKHAPASLLGTTSTVQSC